eukprot:3435246-Alexandrium_andersonii.AAC.1
MVPWLGAWPVGHLPARRSTYDGGRGGTAPCAMPTPRPSRRAQPASTTTRCVRGSLGADWGLPFLAHGAGGRGCAHGPGR